jgi:hypothetical protein
MFERNRGETFGNVLTTCYSLLLPVLTTLGREEESLGRVIGNIGKHTETFWETAEKPSQFRQRIHPWGNRGCASIRWLSQWMDENRAARWTF